MMNFINKCLCIRVLSQFRQYIKFCSHTAEVSELDTLKIRRVPKVYTDYANLMRLLPVQPASPRLLKVSIIGEPNAGKSTLTNQLMKWRVCSVSKKVHTTRHNTPVVMVNGNIQIVFLDTPGLVTPEHGKKHHLENSLVIEPEISLQHVDVIAVIIDASHAQMCKQLNKELLKLLCKNYKKKSILILNKVDKIKRKQNLLKIASTLIDEEVKEVISIKDKKNLDLNLLFEKTEKKLKSEIKSEKIENKDSMEKLMDKKGWKNFSKVFMISALTGDGVEDIRNYLFSLAYPSPWIYHGSIVTNQTPEEIAIMTVREKLLNHLPKEIPYNLDLKIEMMDETADGLLKIVMLVSCPRKGNVKLVIGSKGKTVSKIVDQARQDLSNTFRCDVSLKLIIKDKETYV